MLTKIISVRHARFYFRAIFSAMLREQGYSVKGISKANAEVLLVGKGRRVDALICIGSDFMTISKVSSPKIGVLNVNYETDWLEYECVEFLKKHIEF